MADLSPKKSVSPLQSLGYVSELLFSIVIPTMFFAWGGRWLDRRFEITPFGTMVGLVIALVVVVIIVRKKAEELRALFYPKSS